MSVHSVEHQPTLRDVQAKRSSTRITRAAGQRAVRSTPSGVLDLGLKRFCDVAIALLIVPILLPAMLVIAVLIKADSRGPVLFRQIRYGRNQKTFVILKFRTMDAHPSSDGRQATRDDRRVTRIGRVLRRCSLDEVPQIFNVLRGDMSLVGPRPHALWHDEVFCDLIEGYRDRYLVKPGITGLAQITGCRGETPTRREMLRRVDKDLEYVEKRSFALDLKILLLTVPALFSLRDAY
jgi:putative colanic acid biosysnthesis UDP-glucose lipid carrier transferase